MSAIQTLTIGQGQAVVLLPSITQLNAAHHGAIIVTGSHGGISVVQYALRIPVKAFFFNDAGVGKEQAGISALAALAGFNIVAAAYAHDSARIGDPLDGWLHGLLSHVNTQARQHGMAPQQSVQTAAMMMAR